MALNSGCLVLYKSKCATVTAISADKITIRIDGGDSRSVRPKDVEFLHPGPVASLPPALKPEPDCEELLALMESECFTFADFCDLAYSAFDVSAAWSAYNLLRDGLYFTGSVADGVSARPADAIAADLAARDAKNAGARAREELLERIRSGAILDDDRSAMREIEQVALGKIESSKLLKDLGIAPEPVNAHKLLCKLGVWDEFVNPWPARYDVSLDDPDLALPALPNEKREDLTHLVCYAIDDADSHDPDDAVSFADGLLYIHIADPAAIIVPGSELDREAEARGANLYLPEKISHMLPVAATDVLGLGLNEVSPALTFVVRIADDGSASLVRMTPSLVRVERLVYETAAPKLDESPLREIAAELDRFRQKREADGALFIDLPEVKVKVVERDVVITPIRLLPVRELVANSMLAAGSAVAHWADEHGIPMPFASQPEPENRDHASSMAGMFALRRGCAPSTVSTIAGKHSGLGLAPYVRVTSPLRRYADLLAHQQIRRILAGEEPFSVEYIESRISLSEAAGLTRRKLERQSNEFWKLVYFTLHPDWTGEAVLVNREEDRLTFSIPELAYDYKNRFGGKIALDEHVKVKVNVADPVTMTCRMLIQPN